MANETFNMFAPDQYGIIPALNQNNTGNNLMSTQQGGGSIFDAFGKIFGGGDARGGLGDIGKIIGGEGFQSGLNSFNTLASMYTGFKALGLAKDQFKFQKSAWNKQYNAQVKDYENQLKDKWAANKASSVAQGTQFEGMDSWVADRALAP